MKNNVLKLTVALGLVLVSSTAMNAQKTWSDLGKADDADTLRNRIVARLNGLEVQPASDYRNAKISLWKTRRDSLDDLLAQSIDNPMDIALLYTLVSTDEDVVSLKKEKSTQKEIQLILKAEAEEKATQEAIQRLLKEDEDNQNQRFLEKEAEEEKATQEAIQRLLKEDEDNQGRAFEYAPEWYQRVTSEITKSFAPIRDKVEELARTQQQGDVHTALDNFYGEQSGNLVKIADELFPGKGDLKLAEIKAGVKLILETHPGLLDDYNYEGKTVTKEEMLSYIDKVYQADMPEKLCSYTYNLALEILSSRAREPAFGVHRVFDAIAENELTGGGCLEGRRDRQFVALTSMLGHLGL